MIFTQGLKMRKACDGMRTFMDFQTLQRDGRTLDGMTSDGLSVLIDRQGAEMVSIARDGTGFLHRDGELAPPAGGWANHATVMGYFLHRLWQEQSLYRGILIRGGNHGFLRHFQFAEPERLPDGLAYRVEASEVPPGAYPLKVSLTLSYRLCASSVRVEFAFSNEEPDLEAHVSFGLHPGFCLGSLEAANIILPRGKYVRYLAPGNFLNGQTETLDFPGGAFPYPKKDLPGSFILGLDGLDSREFLLEDPQRRTTLMLDFSEVPYVTFWSDAEDFICIEPCWGLPDSNPPVAFEKKAGIQVIAPGSTLKRGFSMKPNILV